MRTREENNECRRIRAELTYCWSMKTYFKLMWEFDRFHEQIDHHAKDDQSVLGTVEGAQTMQ